MINGTINNSVLSYNVHVDSGSSIKDSVIMPDVRIGKNVKIERAIIPPNSIIEDDAVIGSSDPNENIVLYCGNQQYLHN
jgi:glucose-1-phosphate adenylyltransferase